MSSSSASIDEQIADEIKRIARDVIDWDKSEATETGCKPHWKPRFDTDGLRVERKRISSYRSTNLQRPAAVERVYRK